MSNKLVVIGGGAGGGSFAARVRRHDNDAEIVIYERSPFVSYSNCGQPYLISGAKPNFDAIIVYSPQDWKEQYNVVAKPSHEVVGIDRKKKTVTVKNLISGETFEDSYDKLVIAAGSPALMPPIPGADAKNVHVLKTPDHLQAIMKDLKGAKNAVVIGAGFIGLEIAENLAETKVKTTVIDSAPSLLGKVMDEDFAVFVNKALDENNVDLKLNSGVVSINKDGKEVELADGTKVPSDVIFMVVGVRPELNMYKEQGLTVGVTGGLKVDKSSLTNDKDIYAIGDLAETVDWKGHPSRIQLAIIAQRMATIGANHMYGVKDEFKGVQNSASLTVFNRTVAAVGYTEAYLNEKGIKYTKA
ncbi:MAG: FAD-dependent oxidoreductase, partial [Mycoplasmataceae bacterium]|nr:FAD-dependent oxidoreductase [Mycoplasmataceae bacterium]